MNGGCPLLAQSGHSNPTRECPLSGVKGPRRLLRPLLDCRMELEPYHEAHHHNRRNQNDQKGSGVESHGATFFNARTMRSFKLFA